MEIYVFAGNLNKEREIWQIYIRFRKSDEELRSLYAYLKFGFIKIYMNEYDTNIQIRIDRIYKF